MIVPAVAPVSPRILSRLSGVPTLLEDEVRDCLRRLPDARICVQGTQGAGKTCALRHLAAVLTDCGPVRYLDSESPSEWFDKGRTKGCAVVFSASDPSHVPSHAARRFHLCQLAPWCEDDLIEYLLVAHRKECGSVIRRLHGSGDIDLLGGVPELCRVVLDHLAENPEVASVRESLASVLRLRLPPELRFREMQEHCLDLLVGSVPEWTELRRWLAEVRVAEPEIRILRHQPVLIELSADILIRDLLASGELKCSSRAVPRELVVAASTRVAADLPVQQRLVEGFAETDRHKMPLFAGILHRVLQGWRPPPVPRYFLEGAELAGAPWRNLHLRGAGLARACLDDADLRRVDLDLADLTRTSLCRARLGDAHMHLVQATHADFTGADLSGVEASRANFEQAVVFETVFDGAKLSYSCWRGVALADSSFIGADFTGADLEGATLRRVDLSDCDFAEADLAGVSFVDAVLLGASFRDARLPRADFEYMVLPRAWFVGANLRHAKFTGSVIPGGDFRGACLRRAELAEVQWEHVDLRGADLRGARFHTGTSRSGVVVGGRATPYEHPPIYPDEEQNQDFLPPESIRVANLCGANLRGADIQGVDFYLVDLRFAVYDDRQAEILARSGAILHDPDDSA